MKWDDESERYFRGEDDSASRRVDEEWERSYHWLYDSRFSVWLAIVAFVLFVITAMIQLFR